MISQNQKTREKENKSSDQQKYIKIESKPTQSLGTSKKLTTRIKYTI